jgi:hypothetical protein
LDKEIDRNKLKEILINERKYKMEEVETIKNEEKKRLKEVIGVKEIFRLTKESITINFY